MSSIELNGIFFYEKFYKKKNYIKKLKKYIDSHFFDGSQSILLNFIEDTKSQSVTIVVLYVPGGLYTLPCLY